MFGLVIIKRFEGGGKGRGEVLGALVIFNMFFIREVFVKLIDSC